MGIPLIYCDSDVLSALATGRGLEERPQESKAIEILLIRVFVGEFVLVDSFMIRAELRLYADKSKRALRRKLLDSRATVIVSRTRQIGSRSKELGASFLLKPGDANHVACAEAAGATAMLTYDKEILALNGKLKMPVLTPSQFLKEQE